MTPGEALALAVQVRAGEVAYRRALAWQVPGAALARALRRAGSRGEPARPWSGPGPAVARPRGLPV
jgi:hypothetical protein